MGSLDHRHGAESPGSVRQGPSRSSGLGRGHGEAGHVRVDVEQLRGLQTLEFLRDEDVGVAAPVPGTRGDRRRASIEAVGAVVEDLLMPRVEWSVTPADALEEVVGVLLCRENPDATRIKPSRGDGGIDVLVSEPGAPKRIEIYQVKSFTRQPTAGQKGQVERSLRRVRAFCSEQNLEITGWYLTMPVVPTNETRKWFLGLTDNEEFPCHWRGLDFLEGLAARYPEVIDYYLHDGRERLNAAVTPLSHALRLAQRAARRPTTDEEASEPATLQPGETLDGLAGLYDLLNRDDPHYRYEFAVTATPPRLDQAEELLVAAVQQGSDAGCVTVKVFARFREAVVERPVPGSVSFDPSEHDELARDLDLFGRFGRPFNAPAGTVTGEMDLPGGLGGNFEGAAAQIGPPQDGMDNEQLRFAVLSPDDEVLAEPVLNMQPMFRGSAGVGRYGEEQHGAFGLEMLTELSRGHTSLTIKGLALPDRRPQLLLEGLRFVTEFRPPNRFRIRPAYGPGQSPPTPIPERDSDGGQAEAVYEFVEALALIQQYTTHQLLVPDVAAMNDQQQHAVLWAARLLRGEVIRGTWSQIQTMHLHPGLTIDSFERFAIRLFKKLSVAPPGAEDLDLGLVQIDLPAAHADPDSMAGHDDHHDVRLVPAGSNIALFRYRPPGATVEDSTNDEPELIAAHTAGEDGKQGRG